MRNRYRISIIGVAVVAVIGVLSLAVTTDAGQAQSHQVELCSGLPAKPAA